MSGEKPGLAARRLAHELIDAVLQGRETLEEALEKADPGTAGPRDRSFAHAIAATTLRRSGEADAILATFLAKPLRKSSGLTRIILLSGIVQLLMLETPAHAVIDCAVSLAHEDKGAKHFAKLINAVLRRVSLEGRDLLGTLDAVQLDTPDWLMRSFAAAYGARDARRIAEAHLHRAPIDITAKSDPQVWAERLGGTLLPTGSIRLDNAENIPDLPGYREGAWWVQDAAAALPAKLAGDVRGRRVLDLCAAPGGKTAQLAAKGAEVTAVDISESRLQRIRENLGRLGLAADVVARDVLELDESFQSDVVLLDAPCSATGTIRRHPDLPHLKTEKQVKELAKVQRRLLDHAARLVRGDGLLIYCTCSLQPEEGEMQAARFLARTPGFRREPVAAGEIGGQSHCLTPDGDLRTLPFMTIGDKTGLDGFFAARFRRI